jgi:hypothetical protein
VPLHHKPRAEGDGKGRGGGGGGGGKGALGRAGPKVERGGGGGARADRAAVGAAGLGWSAQSLFFLQEVRKV